MSSAPMTMGTPSNSPKMQRRASTSGAMTTPAAPRIDYYFSFI